MYRKIMVPVDLEHLERLEKALKTARDLSRHYGAKVIYVGVTSSSPGSAARNPEEYQVKLEEAAKRFGGESASTVTAKSYTVPDPVLDLGKTLEKAVDDLGADLVVMATHLPHFGDALFGSNAGRLARHSDVSIFMVR